MNRFEVSKLIIKHKDRYKINIGWYEEEWVLCEINLFHVGGMGIIILEGRTKGKFWYLFSDTLLIKA